MYFLGICKMFLDTIIDFSKLLSSVAGVSMGCLFVMAMAGRLCRAATLE